MVRSILYATDLGLYAPYVLQHALSMSRACKAELYVVHAVEPMGLFAESVLQTYLDERTLREFRENGLETVMASIEQRVMEGFRDELSDTHHDASMISHIRVVRGDPAQVILEQSHSLAVDLVILGSHSHGDTQDTPLGRTASRVLQLSEIPVYLVPMLQHRGK
ncbi:universal stress protein [Pseudomonas sp. LRF_L74]|uniref:universal stress protein n=1 Tax=Pseudomonas sp. LRF_L74 TaxID=3369422 RepID=UPI003F623785